MKKSSTASVLGFTMSLLLLSGCSTTPKVEPVTSVEVKTVEIARPAPIVPSVDQLSLRDVNWIILNPENIDEKFAEIKNGDLVFFALTKDGYENLSLNLSDVRMNIEQYKRIIAIYKAQF